MRENQLKLLSRTLYFIAKKLSDKKRKKAKKNKKNNGKREKGNFLFFFIKNIYYTIFCTVFLYCDIIRIYHARSRTVAALPSSR